MKKLGWICLIFFNVIVNAANSCSINNVTHVSEAADSISLQWDLTPDCADKPGSFQVSIRRQKVLACHDFLTGEPESSYLTNQTFLVAANLFPNSLYEVNIFGVVNRKHVARKYEATTMEGTPQLRPVKRQNCSLVFGQAIRFCWSKPVPANCDLINGKFRGYRVELWGLDPWVPLGRHLREDILQDSALEPQYYAQHLQSFTRYKLKVFIVNSRNLSNQHLPLELTGQTLPSIPQPPDDVRVTLATSTSVHLNIRPKYPPNGLISLFVVRVGVITDSDQGVKKIIWRKRLELKPEQSYCSQSPTQSSVCFVIDQLDPDTGYDLQVQVFNDGVNKSSEFSNGTFARTHALPGSATKDVTTQSSAFSGINNVPQSGSGNTVKILTIVVTLAIIVLLVIACTALYYKIKMKKLELLYEQSRINYNGSALAGLNPPVGLTGFTDSSRLTGLQQTVRFSSRNGGRVVLPHNGMSTASYIQTVANQIEEIQSRRLPEPPPTNSTLKRRSRSDDDDISEDYVKVDDDADDSGNESMSTRFRREAQADDCTDVDGYLKPTFHRFSSAAASSDKMSRPNSSSNSLHPIPAESYVSPEAVRNFASHSTRPEVRPESSYDRPRSFLLNESNASSENFPLIDNIEESKQ